MKKRRHGLGDGARGAARGVEERLVAAGITAVEHGALIGDELR